MKKFELGSFEFILILTLIDSLLPTIKDILLKQINWLVFLSLFGTFGILYSVYLRKLWGFKLAVFVFGVKTISAIVLTSLYLKDFGLSEVFYNSRLFTINSISLLSLLISLPMLVFFTNLLKKTYRPMQIRE